jgi:hypothetical protein
MSSKTSWNVNFINFAILFYGLVKLSGGEIVFYSSFSLCNINFLCSKFMPFSYIYIYIYIYIYFIKTVNGE